MTYSVCFSDVRDRRVGYELFGYEA